MPVIRQIYATQILDSRGIPTVKVNMILDNGMNVNSSVPSGTSTGKYEAVEIRDENPARYFGMEVQKAIINVNTIIAPKLVGMDPSQQTVIDQALVELDGTINKSRLGANAILPVSQSACKAGAAIYNLQLFDYIGKKYGMRNPQDQLPIPIFNVINGGKHGAGNLDFQEFHIIPTSTKTFPESLRLAVEIYHALEEALTQMNAIHSVGAEGGFAPNLFTNKDALEIILESIRRTEYTFGKDVFLGLDVAASHFYSEGKYHIKDRPKPISADEMIDYYKELHSKIHLYSLEDPFTEDDWKSWTTLTNDLGSNTIVVGDDLLATNKTRLQKAIESKACTGILFKPNQIGTVTEAVEVVKIAKDAGWQTVASHRSGETNDTFIADFAVGVGANYTKFGAPSRGERTIKYNRLLEIDQIIQGMKKAAVGVV
jgi:enolase